MPSDFFHRKNARKNPPTEEKERKTKMKNEIFKIIDELQKQFEEKGNSLHFYVNEHEYQTDTGYAYDGIKFFVKELKEELNNSSLFKN